MLHSNLNAGKPLGVSLYSLPKAAQRTVTLVISKIVRKSGQNSESMAFFASFSAIRQMLS
jgi:hypothetical protein